MGMFGMANRFRWMMLAALLVFNNAGLTADGGSTGWSNLLLVCGVVLAAWVSYRLAQDRPIETREALAISVVQDVLITAGVGITGGYESPVFVLYYPSLAVLGLVLGLPSSLAYASTVGLVYAVVSLVGAGSAAAGQAGAVMFTVLAERWLALYMVLGLTAWAMRHEQSARRQVEATVVRLQRSREALRATLDRLAGAWQSATLAVEPAALARQIETATVELADDCRQIEEIAAELGGRAVTADHRGGLAMRVSGQTTGTARDLASRAWPTAAAVEQAEAAQHRVREIVEAWSARAQAIRELSESVRKVADQTNLLAFNANIEAISVRGAGDGERRQRFAVVADGVRLVADQAIEMARQIEGLSAEMWDGTQQVLDGIDEITGLLQHASALAEMALWMSEQQYADAEALVRAAEAAAEAARDNSACGQAIAGVASDQMVVIARLQNAARVLDGWETALSEKTRAVDDILSCQAASDDGAHGAAAHG